MDEPDFARSHHIVYARNVHGDRHEGHCLRLFRDFALDQGSMLIGSRSGFSQCVNYIRFNEKWFCFRRQEATELALYFYTKTSNLIILYNLRELMENISSIMTKPIGGQRRLHRFAYLIIQTISCYQLHEPRIFYPSGHWPETVTKAHVSAHFH